MATCKAIRMRGNAHDFRSVGLVGLLALEHGFIGTGVDEGKAAILDTYPGPALVVGPGNEVMASNKEGQSLAALLSRGEVPDLDKGIGDAGRSGGVTLCPVTLETGKGTMRLEAIISPMVTPLGGGDVNGFLVIVRDTTMERNLRTALVESRQRYKDLVEVNSDFAWEVDADGVFVFVSPKGALEYTAKELVGRKAAELVVSPESYSPIPFCSEKSLENVEMWLNAKHDQTYCVLTSCVPLVDDKRRWRGARGVCRDVTSERTNEAALARVRHRESLLNHIISAIRDETDPLNMLSAAVVATSRAMMSDGARIYRLSADGGYRVAAENGESEGIDAIVDLFPALDSRAGTVAAEVGNWRVLYAPTLYHQTTNGVFAIWRHKDDSPWQDDHWQLLDNVANQLGIANEQVANHERIINMSRTDGMTGLLNRRAFFEEELPQHILRLKKKGQSAVLFYVDMDNFKLVNDVRGHQTGDEAILKLCQVMVENSRPDDLIARLGGDEFAIWLNNISEESAQARAGELLQASESLKAYSGSADKPLGISVGVALYDPSSDETIEGLMSRADEAMYVVKHAGKGGVGVAPSA